MDKYIKKWRSLELVVDTLSHTVIDTSSPYTAEKEKEVNNNEAVLESNECQTSSHSHENSNFDKIAPGSSTDKKKGRKFMPKWKSTFGWIDYNENIDKVFCAQCKMAYVTLKTKPGTTIGDVNSYDAYVKNGYNNWRHALDSFRSHEKSNLHKVAVNICLSIEKGLSIVHFAFFTSISTFIFLIFLLTF